MKSTLLALVVAAMLTSASAVTYRVKAGDTLSGLAQARNISLDTLRAANPGLRITSTLHIGQVLQLPAPGRPSRTGAAVIRPASIRVVGLPVQGRITTGYSPNRGHAGIDIAAPIGSPLRVPQSGRVVESYFDARSGWGWTVLIDLGSGFRVRYSHNSVNLVQRGQWVNAGQVVARVGSTGHSTGPHVDYRLTYNGQSINPLGAT